MAVCLCVCGGGGDSDGNVQVLEIIEEALAVRMCDGAGDVRCGVKC